MITIVKQPHQGQEGSRTRTVFSKCCQEFAVWLCTEPFTDFVPNSVTNWCKR